MSESAPEARSLRPAPQQQEAAAVPHSGWQRKVGPLPLWAWMAIGAGGVALGWYVYRNYKNSKAASSASASTATAASSGSGMCMDASGTQVPCSQVDYGGQIATLQTEIMDLQGAPPAASTTPAATSTTPTVTVSNLAATNVTSSHVSLTWTPPAGAWFFVITYSTGSSNGPVSVTGGTTWTSPTLKSKTAYTFKVQVSPDSSGTQQLGPNATVSATTS